jgi:signal transduction histidine kinase
MRFRYRSIRARTFLLVLTPLVSLVGLYIYATTAAASNAITLARATSVRDSIDDPTGLFVTEVQQERLTAAVLLARPSRQAAAALSAQEPKTNAELSTLRSAVAQVAGDEDPGVRSAITAMLQETAGLPALRARVSSGSLSTAAAQQAYTAVIAAGFGAIGASFQQMPDVHLVSQSSAVLRIAEAEDQLLQAQALLDADAAAGSFPAADRARFAMLTGSYQGLLGEALPDLDPAYRGLFERAAGSPQSAVLNALDAQVTNAPPRRTGVSAAEYVQVSQAVATGLALAAFSAGQGLADALKTAAGPINLRLAVTGGVGLAAIIASIALSLWIGRGIVLGLARLRREALELARQRLPRVMARLSSGEDVDVEAEVPPLPADTDEIGEVRQAFNNVQRAAIEAGAEQARLRSGLATIFRNLAMRSQALLYQQLFLLDALEQRANEPEELERLFQIDHLATRMRRNAEGLLILAGDQPGRTWTDPVPMVDVMRGAVAEIVEYARMRVVCSSRAAIQGYAVADVIHLIAELAENAAAYSPPDSLVRISGAEVVRGFVVEVEDRGLGIPASAAARLNAVLADPPPFNPAESDRLGLYVAARLAQRHNIGITLRESPYGGTTAIVFIPGSLIVSDETHPGLAPGNVHRTAANGRVRPGASPPAALSGRHASREVPGGAGDRPASATAPPLPPRTPVFDSVARLPSLGSQPASPADGPAGAEFQLPRRVRQANLPPHLGGKPPNAESPVGRAASPKLGAALSDEGIRAAFADIQGGMERGNREDLVSTGRDGRRHDSRDPRGASLPPWERSTGDNGRQY